MWIAISNAIGQRVGTGGGPGPGYTPILDDYPNAAAAYSVRLLSSSFSGSALRVRRTVAPFDEQDIGFDSNGELDTAAITTFGGSDSLTLSAWYDQSGSGNNATQVTASSQPQIYNGTAVITENGKPAVKFDGSNDFLTTASFAVTDGEWYASAVCTQTALSSKGKIWSADQRGQTRTAQFINMANGTSQTIAFTTTTKIDSGPTYTAGEQCLLTAQNQSNALEIFKNGIGNGPVDGSNQVTATRTCEIGAAGTSNNEHNGTIQEVVHWATSQSNRTGIESNINTYFSIY